MDLDTFKGMVESWIQQFKNLRLSGVAQVVDEHQEYWSASLIVQDAGLFPAIADENIGTVCSLCETHPLGEMTFIRVNKIRFIMAPVTMASRWQIQWLFRDSHDKDNQ